MSITEFKLELKSFLSETCNKTKNDKLNICAYIYKKLIQSPKEAPELLQYFWQDLEQTESTNSKPLINYISESTQKELHKQYAELVDALFEQLLSKNLPVEAFYKKAWDIITTSPSLDDENAQIFALYYIWVDVRIPYFQLQIEDRISMSNKEFQEYSESLYPIIQKARFIVKTNLFEQRTARASVLLKLINELKTDKEKAVIIAHILSLSTSIHANALREMLDDLFDDETT